MDQEQLKKITEEALKIKANIDKLAEERKSGINADSLVSGNDKIQTPEVSSSVTKVADTSPLPEIDSLVEKRSGVEDKIAKLEEELVGLTSFEKEEAERLDISGRRDSLNESRKRFLRIQAEGEAIEDQIRQEFEGTATTERALSGMINKAQRENRVKLTQERATFEALSGDLNTALDLLEDAVSFEVAPIENELRIRRAQLESIEGYLSPLEKKQAELQKAKLDEEESVLEEKKKDIKEARTLAISLGEVKAPSSVIREILNIANVDDIDLNKAIELAAPYLAEQKTSSGSVSSSEKFRNKVMSATDRDDLNEEAEALGLGPVAYVGDTFAEAQERMERLANGQGFPLSRNDPRVTGDTGTVDPFEAELQAMKSTNKTKSPNTPLSVLQNVLRGLFIKR